MKKNNNRRLASLVVIGVLAISAAWFVRSRMNETFPSTSSEPIEVDPFANPVAVADLSATKLVVLPTESIGNNENVVYCPIIALAWPEFKNIVPEFNATPFTGTLDEIQFSHKDISSDDVLIFAGRRDDEKLATELRTFGLTPNSNLIPIDSRHETTIFAALKKQLSFTSKFERFVEPLTFHKGDAFGVTSDWETWAISLDQIEVLDYRTPDDFIIQIDNAHKESMVLAKIPKPRSLVEGMAHVQERIKKSKIEYEGKRAVAGEQVVIPVLEFSLIEDFTAQFQKASTRVQSARQLVQFHLNEKGAQVLASFTTALDNGHYDVAVGERTFIFDKPFMIVLRESNDRNPYFATWIANSDFMKLHE